MKAFLPIVVGFVLSVAPVFANGGGYNRGGVESTGSVAGFEPKGTEHIRILEERLTVWLGPDEAEVEVRYLMRNESKKRVKVRFGFPVEESFDEEFMTGKPSPRGKLAYCRDYRVAAAGKALKATFERETERKDPRFKGLRGWIVSKMSFRGGEEIPVVISFRSAYPESAQFVSEDGHVTAKIFRYRLSTAACWAGTIGSGRVVLHPNGIDPTELRVLKPVNRFRKEKKDGSWVWEFENLEPSLADDMEIEAVPHINSRGSRLRPGASNESGEWPNGKDRVDYIERNDRWLMAHTNYTVKASSTLPPDGDLRYGAGNINDDDWENAWSEGAAGPGRGEWLEIRPEVAKPLAALKLHPGYGKTEELFRANARPKRIKVELNGEHSFTAEVPDRSNWREWCWIPIHGYDKPVKVLKITFEDVREGTRFDDMCVSGLQLVVKLNKEPKTGPVR